MQQPPVDKVAETHRQNVGNKQHLKAAYQTGDFQSSTNHSDQMHAHFPPPLTIFCFKHIKR